LKAYSLPKLNPNQYVIKAYVTYSGARQTPKFFNLRVERDERESRMKSPPFGFFCSTFTWPELLLRTYPNQFEG
jgi:hypothetical protein